MSRECIKSRMCSNGREEYLVKKIERETHVDLFIVQ